MPQPLAYDINQYLTQVLMSSKIRILVEGKEDFDIISNYLYKKSNQKNIKIDKATELKGICEKTAKNHRKK